MLHGETELEKAVRASEVLFGKEISGLSVNEILDIFADVPSTELEKSKLESDGFTLGDALVPVRARSFKGRSQAPGARRRCRHKQHARRRRAQGSDDVRVY
jgi:tyrosyl-tRNA synthetase